MCIQKPALFGACAAIVLMAGQAAGQLTGPSGSASPYVTPIAPGVITLAGLAGLMASRRRR